MKLYDHEQDALDDVALVHRLKPNAFPRARVVKVAMKILQVESPAPPATQTHWLNDPLFASKK